MAMQVFARYGANLIRELGQTTHGVTCYRIRAIQHIQPYESWGTGNMSQVRSEEIAAINIEIDTRVFLQDYLPHRIGNHIYVSSNLLYFSSTQLHFNTPESRYPSYIVSPNIPIHCVYPILFNGVASQSTTGSGRGSTSAPVYQLHSQSAVNSNPRAGQLCLGLHFKHDLRTGDRESVHFQTNTPQKRGVFNITEDYFTAIHDSVVNNRGVTLQDTQRFIRLCTRFALYVGSGARLVVLDQQTEKQASLKCQSLFQPGSFVIVEGDLKVTCPLTSGNSQGPLVEMSFLEALQHPTLFPNEWNRNVKPDAQHNMRFVIFLGPIQSKFNTACWKLNVTYKMVGNKLVPQGNLFLPDGGHILGIERWVRGYKEIYYRHRYERLYEGGLRSVRFGGTCASRYGYLVPDEDMRNRILCAGIYFKGSTETFFSDPLLENRIRSFEIDLSAFLDIIYSHLNPEELQTIDRYIAYTVNNSYLKIEKVLQRWVAPKEVKVETEGPNAPEPNMQPLLLPIKEQGQLRYLAPGTDIKRYAFDGRILLQIEDMIYSIGFEEMPEYRWKRIDYPREFTTTSGPLVPWNGLEYRCGIDCMIYQRINEVIGRIETYYLQLFSQMN